MPIAFVPADVEDDHAVAFYTALGGQAAPVTIFTVEDRVHDRPDAPQTMRAAVGRFGCAPRVFLLSTRCQSPRSTGRPSRLFMGSLSMGIS